MDLFVNGILSSFFIPWRLRNLVFNLLGMKIKLNSAIHADCYISGNKIKIGKGSYINRRCVLDCCKSYITIGDQVGIACCCKFITTSHEYIDEKKRTGQVVNKPIIIGDGVWIGADSIILPGVKIENGVIIAAGSVVTKNCQQNRLYAGNPAREIKKI